MTLYTLHSEELDENKIGVQANTVLISTSKPQNWWGTAEEDERVAELNRHLPNLSDIQKMAVIGKIIDLCRYK